MFQVYVINALGIPNSTPSLKQRPDPYAVLFVETDSRRIELGRTEACSKTSNPVWDKDASKSFNITVAYLKKITLIVYDSMDEFPEEQGDPEVGRYTIDFEDENSKPPINSLAQLKLDTEYPCKFKPNVQIKITLQYGQIEKFKFDLPKEELKTYSRMYFTLTYNPPIKNDELKPTTISFMTFDLEDGGRARVIPRMCNNDNRGVKIKYPKYKVSKTGYSPIASFNLPKLECHLFSTVEMLYNPLIKCEGYTGKVTIWCFGASKNVSKQPIYIFHDTLEFNAQDKSETITSAYVIQPSPNLSEYHIKTIEQFNRSSFPNDLVFVNYMKEVALPLAAKKFLRLELDINKAVTLSYASQFHQRSLPAQLVFYTDWMSTAGHPLDLGISLYDNQLNSIDHICADRHDACDGALTWNVSTDGRFEKFKKDTLFLRVRLARLPKNVEFISVALAAYSMKPFPLKWGGFFRLYDEDDMFEYMNLSIRDKGSATGVIMCIMWKLDDGDWLVIPTIQKLTIKQGPPGLVQHFRAIAEYLRNSTFLDEIQASMNQYEMPTKWYELLEKREKEKEAKKAQENQEKSEAEQ